MGRYSDSDDERRQSRKKKKKSRSKSRSLSSEDSRSGKRSKHKKSKKKQKRKSRSRSLSSERLYKSRTRRRSRSRSRERRSPVRSRRSRSRSEPRAYARRRSRSRSRTRHRRMSRSRSRDRLRRSRSRSRRRSRSGSRSKRSSRNRSTSKERTRIKEEPKCDPCANIPGFDLMTAAEQAEIRLQMALKAAAAADEKLKEQGVLSKSTTSNANMSLEDQRTRIRVLEDLEKDDFAPAVFSSTKGQSKARDADADSAHASAIFGGDLLNIKSEPIVQINDINSIMHPNLYVSYEEKMDRWIKKLASMRRRKLEGEAMY